MECAAEQYLPKNLSRQRTIEIEKHKTCTCNSEQPVDYLVSVFIQYGVHIIIPFYLCMISGVFNCLLNFEGMKLMIFPIQDGFESLIKPKKSPHTFGWISNINTV